MGVIQRQGLKASIISYIGVAIGAVSTMFVYPHALEMVGLFRSLYDASVIIGIFVLLGSSVSAVRFFPKFQQAETGHKGFLTWLLLVMGVGFLLFLLAYPFIQEGLKQFSFKEDNAIYEDFVIYIIPLTFMIALGNLLSKYISNFKRIAIPSALEQLTIKIALPLIVLMFIQGWIGPEGVVIGVIASFAFVALGMAYYAWYLGEFKLTRPLIFRDKSAMREFSQYSWYGLLSGIGSQVAFRIDGLMVSSLIRFEAGGIYAISLALSDIIAKPMRSLANIAGPLLAEKIEHQKMDEVKSIYQKSALNMTIIGTGLFLSIWTVLPYIFTIMPKTDLMMQGRYVVFFLGLAQLLDMMTGVNSEIIAYSKHFRFNLYLILILAVLNVMTNFIFIPMYGIPGAALATCLSMFVYNLIKLIFIYSRMGIQPFTPQIIPAIGFGLAAWLIAYLLPEGPGALFNLIYKGGVFGVLYGLAIFRFTISPDINQWVIRVFERVRQRR